MTEDELYSLERIVSAYLDLAENRARRRIPMTMADWAKRLDVFLMADDRKILTNAGTITTVTQIMMINMRFFGLPSAIKNEF